MNSLTVELFKARDAEDSYAIRLDGEPPGSWRAQSGFGGDFTKEWCVELQSRKPVDLARVSWDSILERAVEAYQLSDPVITEYEWPEA